MEKSNCLFMETAIHDFIMNFPGFDFIHVSASNPFDPTLNHQRFGKGLAVGNVAAAFDMHATHAKVAQFVLIAKPD